MPFNVPVTFSRSDMPFESGPESESLFSLDWGGGTHWKMGYGYMCHPEDPSFYHVHVLLGSQDPPPPHFSIFAGLKTLYRYFHPQTCQITNF